jgi:hypothetical protein
MTAGMMPHERLPFAEIDERPPLHFPKGIRTVVWPVLALEVWDISRPMARMIIPPPQGQPMLPDHPNWSWHEYGDWVLDDEPVNVKTAHGTIVALPYNFELHDIVAMALQGHSSERATKYFDCIHGESADRAKIMSMAHHIYLSGSPHRIADVRRTYEYILAKDGVVTWDGSQILDWFRRAQ